ncbi:hypothetical protein BJY14_000562 [Actinomadura luteofluorescens]|uniref:Uncharacterized protein n=1 Tax=Actinomadura luteofluorescens TaxID=46163 RepID=A0A7Y9EBB3_9ACTN|nr:hypothetical protein [Actinomadura luteofluorescens]
MLPVTLKAVHTGAHLLTSTREKNHAELPSAR